MTHGRPHQSDRPLLISGHHQEGRGTSGHAVHPQRVHLGKSGFESGDRTGPREGLKREHPDLQLTILYITLKELVWMESKVTQREVQLAVAGMRL